MKSVTLFVFIALTELLFNSNTVDRGPYFIHKDLNNYIFNRKTLRSISNKHILCIEFTFNGSEKVYILHP